MKSYRLKIRDTSNIKVKVIVNPEVIPEGGCYDVPKPPNFPRPKLPRKFFGKVTKPAVDGHIQYVYRDR